MPVTERLMKAGQWSLTLSPETPKAIRDLVDFFGHVYVFDSPPRTGQSDATMLGQSRWAGIVRRRQTPWSVSGVNMVAWLGDEDGKGPILETAVGDGTTGNSFTTLLVGLLAQCPGVTPGTATTVSGTSKSIYQWITPRAALDAMCLYFGAEYRVNRDSTIDTAPVGSTAMFKQTPTAAALLRSSGRDLSVIGVSVVKLDVSIDSEEYITRALIQDTTSAWSAANASGVQFRSLGSDSASDLGAWTIDAGTPTIAASVVSMPASSRMHGGPVLGDLAYNLRFITNSAGRSRCLVHYVDVNNYVYWQYDGAAFDLRKVVGGTDSLVTTTAATLTNATPYWFSVTVAGAVFTGKIFTDSGGTMTATQAGTTCTGTISDGGVRTGAAGIGAGTGGTQQYGGAYANVCLVTAPTHYRNLNGSMVRMAKSVQSSTTPNAEAATVAANVALAGNVLRNEVRLSTDEYDIDRDVAVGDWIWVFDQDSNMVDLGNAVRYRGGVLFPIKLRVLATTWPIERGMSVWYRDSKGSWTNLSDFVVWESPGATFELGAAKRALLTTP